MARWKKTLRSMIFILFVMIPLLGAILQHTGYVVFEFKEREISLLTNSIQLGFGTAILSVTLGFFCSLGIHNSRIHNKWYRYYFVLFLPVPFYVYALNWMYFFRDLGKLYPTFLRYSVQGFAPCLYVETIAFFPLATLFLLIGMEKIDSEKIRIGLLYKKDNMIACTIVLREVLPFIMAAIGVVSILSMTEFSVPSMFQYNTYALDLFSVYSRTGDAFLVFLKSVPLCMILAVPFGWFYSVIHRIDYRQERGKYQLELTGVIKFFSVLSIVLSIAAIVIPIFIFAIKIEDIQVMTESIKMIQDEIMTSLLMSLFSGIIAVLIGSLPKIDVSNKKNIMIKLLIMYAIVVPGAIQAMGLLKVINSSALWKLQKTLFLSSFGCALKYTPYVVILLIIARRRIDPKKIEMIELMAPTTIRESLSKIYMLRRGILMSFLIVFLLSFAEESIPLVLMAPGNETITVKIYNYLHYGASEYVAAFSIVVLILIFACELFAGMLIKYVLEKRS